MKPRFQRFLYALVNDFSEVLPIRLKRYDVALHLDDQILQAFNLFFSIW